MGQWHSHLGNSHWGEILSIGMSGASEMNSKEKQTTFVNLC